MLPVASARDVWPCSAAGRAPILPVMKRLLAAAVTASLVFIAAGHVRAQEELTCEDYRCQFQARLDECSCEQGPSDEGKSPNHGAYVSCVAHIVNDLVAEGLPTKCKGKLKRCAARSVCGKQESGFATCTTFEYGTCVEGVCDTDGVTTCTADTDCIASTRCKITRHPETCEAAGGAVNLAPTCCSSCTTAP
jgi:hypothetical protein